MVRVWHWYWDYSRYNVSLIEGRFEDTLEGFLKEHSSPVDMVHLDCDVFSSTKTALYSLTDRIHSGTVMVFDELLFYRGCEDHEAGALYEWLRATKYSIRWIGIHGTKSGTEILEQAKLDANLRKQLLGPEKKIVPWNMPLAERVALQIV
ncbi:TylF/MycF/NovP-related O-methyltransferase [Crocosphaera sp. Alani8]|uniref:TylF/MycF/NovP-related O-methyltransferase n=1 Tax=Crocosphaera sp. Alani8 TaxID=3038952 RepID=UPI00313AEEE0